MPDVGEERKADEKFIIVGCGDRKKLAASLCEEFGTDIAIIAPIERKMVRPRRKSSKTLAHWVEVPLFLEYAALQFEMIGARWPRLFQLEEVWYVLTNQGRPVLLSFDDLDGLCRTDIERGWEGATVEFTRGPMAGRQGVYRDGFVLVSVFGREVRTSANLFDLRMAPFHSKKNNA